MNSSNPVTAPLSIDPAEIAHFEALAEQWWDPHGKFGILHKFNPARLGFIREAAGSHFKRDPSSRTPFTGLRLLDIGCGGGLLSEPMARLGATVIGVDAAPGNIKTAAVHATAQGLAIDYRNSSAEALAAAGERFDIILNMEVIEHVANLEAFLGACGAILKPGGIMVVATINRTPKAYALAIVAAERILRWVPRGTHDYRKLVKPAELESGLEGAGLTVLRWIGVAYDALNDRWTLSPNLDVNYMAVAENPAN